MNPYDPKRPLYQNGDRSLRDQETTLPRDTDDPFYGMDESTYEEYFSDLPQEPERETGYRPQRPRKKKHRFVRVFLRLVLILLVLLVALAATLHFLASQPVGGAGARKSDCSTILLAGTDESGDRTDTIMLLNVNRETKQLSLLSIPRDTRVNSIYTPQKINGAYGANGKGAEGMNSLMDYVADCVGFRPDGYLLVDLDVFVELVDLFGGVEFDVPRDMDYDDPSQGLSIHLRAGLQTLDGEQAMGVVRYRYGYSMADLERVDVQRDFLMAALGQWASPAKAIHYFSALSLLSEHMLTDLSRRDLIWLAESVILCGTENVMTRTVPFYLDNVYVYIDAGDAYLDLINTYFNPYVQDVGYDDLNLAYG